MYKVTLSLYVYNKTSINIVSVRTCFTNYFIFMCMHDQRSNTQCIVSETFTYPGLGSGQRYRGSNSIGFLCLSAGGSTKNNQIWVTARKQNDFWYQHTYQTGWIILNITGFLPGHFNGFRKPKYSLKKHSVYIDSVPNGLWTRVGAKYIKIAKTWMKNKMAEGQLLNNACAKNFVLSLFSAKAPAMKK